MGTARKSVENTGECVWNLFCSTNSRMPLPALETTKTRVNRSKAFSEKGGIAHTPFHGVKPQEILPRLFLHAFHTPKAFCLAAP